jgi:hypothetical protein
MTRFWPEGMAIAVMCDDAATPKMFTWQGHRHRVVAVHDRWRVDEGWWRRRAWREYFQLITASGLLAEIYHDVPSGRWYLQRVYD